MTTKVWSQKRKDAAVGVAATLYGVVMILAATLAVQPGELTMTSGILGALGVGVAILATRCFTEVVKAETESGSDVEPGGVARILRAQAPVMVFPLIIAALIPTALAFDVAEEKVIDLVFYLGAASVLLIGFASSYLIDGRLGFALRRAGYWLVFSAIPLVAKKLG